MLIDTIRKAMKRFAKEFWNLHFSGLSIEENPNVVVLPTFKLLCGSSLSLILPLIRDYTEWPRPFETRTYLPSNWNTRR